MTWEEAMEANKNEPKFIFVDVYTDWCGWCKKMDKATFAHPVIAEYMNKHFYSVKFDAEQGDTIQFAGNTFVNPNPEGRRSVHQFARALLDNQLSYPKFVVFNANIERMSIIPGFHPAEDFEAILTFLAEGKSSEMSFEEYKKVFEGKIN